jgi:hypothetical protein
MTNISTSQVNYIHLFTRMSNLLHRNKLGYVTILMGWSIWPFYCQVHLAFQLVKFQKECESISPVSMVKQLPRGFCF